MMGATANLGLTFAYYDIFYRWGKAATHQTFSNSALPFMAGWVVVVVIVAIVAIAIAALLLFY